MYLDTIGKRIKYLREQHGLNQLELAEQLGVSNKTVSSWELDNKEPRMGVIEKMSIFFGVKKSDIIDGNDTIFNPTHLILDDTEREMILAYRALNNDKKKMAREHLNYLKFLQEGEPA